MGMARRATLAVAVLSATMAAALAPPAVAASPDVVLAEVYGGGGNAGAPYLNDFVELYNRGGAAVSLAGWSVQYASAAGTSYLVTPLAGSIQPGGRYLVRMGSGGAVGAALPTPDATGSTNLSASAGKVALVTSTAALACGANCDTAAGVRDFIGYGGANDFEGSPAAALSNTESATRSVPSTDTDNNAADFARVAPTPQNSASGGGCGYTGTLIRAVQGSAHVSPLAGSAVSNMRGVVTVVRGNGFWLQDPCPDASPATSEALFVFTSTAPTVTVGQEVAVNGTVTEFRPGGVATANLTTTEITGPTVSVVGTRPLPAPTVIGAGGRVPPSSVIDNDATGSVETSGSFDASTDGIDFYESMEGMRVQVNNPVAVGPRNSNGEIPVLADNGAGSTVRTTRGGIVLRSTDANPERVILDDAFLSGSTPAGVNTGDTFTSAAVGLMDYSFGNFKLALTSALTRVNNGLAKEVAVAPRLGQIAIATFNVENLAATDAQSKFDGLAQTIVQNLRSPAIIVTEEVQDNDGASNTAVVDATQTWNKLIAAVTAAGGPRYEFAQINPVDDADGGEPGGNIRVGFLYRPGAGVSLVPGTPGGPTTAVAALASGNAADPVALSVNPGRINPTSTAFANSRKPIVAKFLVKSQPVFVIGNHWNSKGGDDPLFGHRQPPQRPTEVQRGQQATQVATFVDQLQAIDPNARIVVAGDLNDFAYSPAVQTLVTAGLTDLPATLPDAERYSYVFDGNSQFLDHIMLSASLAPIGYDVVHVNSEFATQLSDHDPQVVRLSL